LSGLTLAQNPFVSPDGQWVGYFEGSTALKKVPIVGGPPVTICRLDGAGPRGATWGPDGTIVFATANGGLWRVRDAGGEPERLTTPESVVHSRPQFLPGGRTILFTILQSGGNLENARIGVLDLQTGVQRVVLNSGGDARYVPSGHLVYGVPGSLFAVGFDIDRLETVGTPVPIVPGVRTVASGADYDVAPDGTLVYVTGGASAIRRTLAWVDRQGREEPVNKAPPRAYAYPRLSPDNTRLALDIRDQENDIWIWDVRRETLSRFTFAPTLDRSPVWTPDGLQIVFSAAGGNGVAELLWQAANGTGTPERLTESKEFQFATTMSHDGGRVVFWQQRQSRDLMVLSLNQQRRIEPLLHTPAAEINGEISPDGRWIAYQSNESGTDEIYVRPFPAVDAGKWQVSLAPSGETIS
jgi:serine/threonine-protein kinase